MTALCEDYHRVDLAWLRRHKLLAPGRSSSIAWSRCGRRTGSIGIEIGQHALRLVYRTRPFGGPWRDVQEVVCPLHRNEDVLRVGFVLVLCNVRIPSLFDHGLSLLGQASGGVALFSSGIMLAAYKIKIDRNVPLLVFLKNIAQPALVLVDLLSLGYGAPIVPETALTTAIPTMPITVTLASTPAGCSRVAAAS